MLCVCLLVCVVCVLQCLCIVLLVLHVDEVGVVVGGGVFVVTLLGYLITQLRVHLLTFAVSSTTAAHLPAFHYSPFLDCRASLNSPHRNLASLNPVSPCPQFLCVDPVVFLVQLFYAGYCLVELRMGLFGHHGYVFLHLVSCLVLTVCVVVAWSLYRQEEVTEEWARQEEELDDLIPEDDHERVPPHAAQGRAPGDQFVFRVKAHRSESGIA